MPSILSRMLASALLLSALDSPGMDVAGTVRNAAGAALDDVRICIQPEGKVCELSDSSGSFHIASPPIAVRPRPRNDPAGAAGGWFYRFDGRRLGRQGTPSGPSRTAWHVLRPAGTPEAGAPKASAGNESLSFEKSGYFSAIYVPKSPRETGVDIRLAAPGDPVEFRIEGGIGSAHLAWDAYPGAERYLIRYSRADFPDSGAGEIEAVSPAVVEGLRPGESYRFQVAAVLSDTQAAWSEVRTLRLVLSGGYAGDPGFTPGPVDIFTAAMDARDRVWVAFADTTRSNRITVMRHSPGGWETVGSPGFAPDSWKLKDGYGNPSSIGLSVAGGGDPLLWYREADIDKIWFWSLRDSAWGPVDSALGRSVAARTTEAIFVQAPDGSLRSRSGAGWDSLAHPSNCPVTSLALGESLTLHAVCSANRDPWSSRAVRLDDTGWTPISRTFPTYDRDVTSPSSLYLAGRYEKAYLVIFKGGPFPFYRLGEEGEEEMSPVSGWIHLFTRAGLPLTFIPTFPPAPAALKYCEPPGNTWQPFPLEGEISAPDHRAVFLLDSKDRLYQVYRDPGRDSKLSVTVLAP